jgi:uncharacterized glyoxalase superfamily protein PhnB
MATRKKSRAKAVSKRANPKKRTAAKAVPRAKKAVRAVTPAKAPAPKARRVPETLRLTAFTPSLTVNDLGKSLAFYTEALGFIVSERWSDGDVLRGVMLKAGACELGISQDDWKMGKDRPKGAGFRIWCDTIQDIDALAARVKAKGGSLTEEPGDRPWGVRSFSVDDPDGFHLTIASKL